MNQEEDNLRSPVDEKRGLSRRSKIGLGVFVALIIAVVIIIVLVTMKKKRDVGGDLPRTPASNLARSVSGSGVIGKEVSTEIEDIENSTLAEEVGSTGTVSPGSDIITADDPNNDYGEWHRIVNASDTTLSMGMNPDEKSGVKIMTRSDCPEGTSDPQCLWKLNDHGILLSKSAPNLPVIKNKDYGPRLEGGKINPTHFCTMDSNRPACLWKMADDGRIVDKRGVFNGGLLMQSKGLPILQSNECAQGTTNPMCKYKFSR